MVFQITCRYQSSKGEKEGKGRDPPSREQGLCFFSPDSGYQDHSNIEYQVIVVGKDEDQKEK